MVLNILLTILIVVLVGITTLMVIWWKKYGKKMFKTFIDLQNTMGKTSKSIDIPNLLNEFGRINNLFKK